MGGSQRARDIGDAAGRYMRQPAAQPSLRSRRDISALSRRRWPIFLSIALVILVIGAGAVVWLRYLAGQSSTEGPFPTVLTFSHDAIACPAGAAWSPDSTTVAVVGFSACSQDQSLPASGPASNATLALFDAKSGQPLHTTDLSAVITAKALPSSVRDNSIALSQAQVLFGAMQWSAHAHQIALGVTTFQADPNGSGQPKVYDSALVLIPDEGAPRVLSAPGAALGGNRSGTVDTSLALLPVIRWDLSTEAHSAITVPQALAYAWVANGMLTATPPLSTAPGATPPAVAVTAVGNPSGDTTFTSWQSGSIGFGSSCAGANGSGGCCTNTSYLTATFGSAAAWSPDDRYVLMSPPGGVSIGATGQMATPPVDASNIPGACTGTQASNQYAKLPVRDKGLSSGLRAFDLSRVGLVVAWSPDGQRIAVRADHSLNGSAHELSIFDCHSGNLLASFNAEQVEHGLPSNRGSTVQFGIGLPPVWSPDGTHLLVLDNDLRVLSILGPNMIGG